MQKLEDEEEEEEEGEKFDLRTISSVPEDWTRVPLEVILSTMFGPPPDPNTPLPDTTILSLPFHEMKLLAEKANERALQNDLRELLLPRFMKKNANGTNTTDSQATEQRGGRWTLPQAWGAVAGVVVGAAATTVACLFFRRRAAAYLLADDGGMVVPHRPSKEAAATVAALSKVKHASLLEPPKEWRRLGEDRR